MFVQQVFSNLRGAFVVSALPLTMITGLPTAAFSASLSAQNFDQIYVFGDSLSDTGNVFNATLNVTGEGFPPAPYYQGRFSNGPVWVEYLATKLGATSTNFAFGGATTGSSNTSEPNEILGLPALDQQINRLTTANPSADPDALYIVWAGANDYLGAGVTDPTVPVNNLSTAVNSLADYGAKNIMVVNLPDLGKLPATFNSPISSTLNDLTEAHNSGLAAKLDFLSQEPDINIIPLDVNSQFNRAIAHPGEFGFTNVTDSCLTTSSVCANPDEYLFWDDIHPTTAGHKLVGDLAYSALNPEPVPEPSAELSILTLGAIGAVSVLKRKKKKASPVKGRV